MNNKILFPVQLQLTAAQTQRLLILVEERALEATYASIHQPNNPVLKDIALDWKDTHEQLTAIRESQRSWAERLTPTDWSNKVKAKTAGE